MSDLASIQNLINPTDDENSVTGRFTKKQAEIKIKEIEKKTNIKASSLGFDYINLFGFPISPEALILIPENIAQELKIVCFYYDGKNIRLGCLEPNDEIKALAEQLTKQYFSDVKIYIISTNSLEYSLKEYKNIPKVRRNENGVEISEESLKISS